MQVIGFYRLWLTDMVGGNAFCRELNQLNYVLVVHWYSYLLKNHLHSQMFALWLPTNGKFWLLLNLCSEVLVWKWKYGQIYKCV